MVGKNNNKRTNQRIRLTFWPTLIPLKSTKTNISYIPMGSSLGIPNLFHLFSVATHVILKTHSQNCMPKPFLNMDSQNWIQLNWYGWWKKSQTTTGDVSNLEHIGMKYQPQLVSRISEPSTVGKTGYPHLIPISCHVGKAFHPPPHPETKSPFRPTLRKVRPTEESKSLGESRRRSIKGGFEGDRIPETGWAMKKTLVG